MSQDEFQSRTLSHLNSISNTLETTNIRLSGIESRLENVESRLEKIEDRLRKIEKFVPTDNADFGLKPKEPAAA